MVTARDETRLAGVQPDLVLAYRVAAGKADVDGTPIFVVGGLRTAAFQHGLYQQGRVTTGPGVDFKHPLGRIVTEKDGYVHKSDHQPEADGFGHAIDFAFLPTKARPDAFALTWPWKIVAGYAVAAHAGVQWGGTWKTPADLDHLQLVTAP
jgi:peptidoglycan L-alanyl-D-glutamate endopeptidase CwlK